MSGPMDLMKMIKFGRVANGGDPAKEDSDFPSDHSVNPKIINETEHGKDVKLNDLGFWPLAMAPGNSSQCQFPGVMDPGSAVCYIKNVGQNGGLVIGQINSINKGGTGSNASGGQSLTSDKVDDLSKRTRGIRIPPNVRKGKRGGADIMEANEKGDSHSLSLLDGLPTHGALHDMTGFKQPEYPKIPTAKQTNDKMLTKDMLEQMQQALGQVMSIGQMFQQLASNGPGGASNANSNSGGGLGNNPDSHWDVIHKSLSPAMSTALNSLSKLIQGHETDNGVSYVTGGVVHTGIYLENAVDLLSNVTTLDDLMNVLQRLQWDTSIMGIEQLDTLKYEIENAWGTAVQEISANGMITITYANTDAEMSFANSMSNTVYSSAATSSSAPSYGGGTNNNNSGGGFATAQQAIQQAQSIMGSLFGKSSGTMQEMWKRLAPSGEQTAKKLHQAVTQSSEAQQQKQINTATTDGGDPTSETFFEDVTGLFSVEYAD